VIIQRLKEKMMRSREAITEIICRAKKERGSPKIIARFRMFL